MKKRLVFFWFIDKEREFSPIYRLHMKLLCRYSGVFDEALFIMSLKVDDEDHRKMAMDVASDLVANGYRNSRFVFELNTEYREAKAFHDYVHSSVVGGKSELIFFGHNKGTTNELTDSLVMWICSMYYFSLERISDAMHGLLSDRKCAYGFPVALCSEEFKKLYSHPVHGFYYSGTMYWVNAAVSHMDVKVGMADVSHPFTDRFYAEEYVGNAFMDTKCGTYRNLGFWDNRINFYYNMDQYIDGQLFDYAGDNETKERFWGFYRSMKNEIGL